MGFESLLIIVLVALGFQILIFFWGRKLRRKEKETNVLLKYRIKSRQDAWRIMGNMEIPEKDRNEIKKWYEQDDEVA
jgi:hypothetical protein